MTKTLTDLSSAIRSSFHEPTLVHPTQTRVLALGSPCDALEALQERFPILVHLMEAAAGLTAARSDAAAPAAEPNAGTDTQSTFKFAVFGGALCDTLVGASANDLDLACFDEDPERGLHAAVDLLHTGCVAYLAEQKADKKAEKKRTREQNRLWTHPAYPDDEANATKTANVSYICREDKSGQKVVTVTVDNQVVQIHVQKSVAALFDTVDIPLTAVVLTNIEGDGDNCELIFSAAALSCWNAMTFDFAKSRDPIAVARMCKYFDKGFDCTLLGLDMDELRARHTTTMKHGGVCIMEWGDAVIHFTAIDKNRIFCTEIAPIFEEKESSASSSGRKGPSILNAIRHNVRRLVAHDDPARMASYGSGARYMDVFKDARTLICERQMVKVYDTLRDDFLEVSPSNAFHLASYFRTPLHVILSEMHGSGATDMFTLRINIHQVFEKHRDAQIKELLESIQQFTAGDAGSDGDG